MSFTASSVDSDNQTLDCTFENMQNRLPSKQLAEGLERLQNMHIFAVKFSLVNILKEWLKQRPDLAKKYITSAKQCLMSGNYSNALLQSKMACFSVSQFSFKEKEMANLLFVESLLAKNWANDAAYYINRINPFFYPKKYFNLKSGICLILGQEKQMNLCLGQIQVQLVQEEGRDSLEYAYFQMKRGLFNYRLSNFEKAMTYFSDALALMSQNREASKFLITEIYLRRAEIYCCLKMFEKEHISLICALGTMRNFECDQYLRAQVKKRLIENLIGQNKFERTHLEEGSEQSIRNKLKLEKIETIGGGYKKNLDTETSNKKC